VVPVTGLEATGAVGSVTTTANANVSVTGVAGTGSVGAATVDLKVDVDVNGVSATGQVGTISDFNLGCTVFPTGVEATGSTTPVLIWDTIVPNQNPEYTSIAPSQTPGWDQIAA
jgi:UDP-N-acetylmuramate-alanine ligase